MEMCYNGNLVMPSNYVVVNADEMEYIDGGALTTWQKALVIGACVAATATLTVALVYGQFALAAKIMGFTIKKVVEKAGAAAVVGCITATLGISGGAVWAAINFLI